MKRLLPLLLICVSPMSAADIVYNDDVIIVSNLCVGFDCANGESFGFDTLRIRDTSARIDFLDTSSTAAFPDNDWALLANDTSSGGANYFAIENRTAVTIPFRVDAGAPTDSLRVDAQGEVGIGTASAELDLHIAAADTPGIRLEQLPVAFGAYTWDVAGNEANFFVRDVTAGFMPFKIRPGTPSNALVAGSRGVGTALGSPIPWSPEAAFHIWRQDGTSFLLVEEANKITAARTLFELRNAGTARFKIVDTATGGAPAEWFFAGSQQDFRISFIGTPVEMRVNPGGNMFITGSLTQNSDRDSKQHIVPVDPQDILARVASLDVSRWQYKDTPGVQHIGPMAQDFHAAFGVGHDETGISSIDTAGVALAAIQALEQENRQLRERDDELTRQNRELDARNRSLEGRLAELEGMVIAIASRQAAENHVAQN